MSKFENLSIADTKALLDFVNESKRERLADLKEEGTNSKDDKQFSDLDKLAYHLHNKLFSNVVKLIKEI